MNARQRAQVASETVDRVLRELPAPVREAAGAVPVQIEARPGRALIEDGLEPDLLGLFCGSPVGTELSEDNPEPPRILLFTENLWDYAGGDPEAYRQEVRVTYLHELGHYLGWDEDQVADRGLE